MCACLERPILYNNIRRYYGIYNGRGGFYNNGVKIVYSKVTPPQTIHSEETVEHYHVHTIESSLGKSRPEDIYKNGTNHKCKNNNRNGAVDDNNNCLLSGRKRPGDGRRGAAGHITIT